MGFVFDMSGLRGDPYFERIIEKARKGEQVGGEYIFRENIGGNVKTSNGKTVVRRYRYYYISDMLKDSAEKLLKNIGSFFFRGKPEEVERIEKSYETENIQKDYGADKKTWYEHVMEYFSHRSLWDRRFADRKTAEKWKKPVKTVATEKIDVKGMETPADKVPEIKTSAEKKPETKKWKANPSLMRKVWSLYTGKQAEKEEKRQATAEKVISEKENIEERESDNSGLSETESFSRCKALYNEAYRKALQDLKNGKALQIDDEAEVTMDELAEDKQAASARLEFYTKHFSDWNNLDTVNATLEMYAEEPDGNADKDIVRMAREKAVQDSLRAYLGLNVNLPEENNQKKEISEPDKFSLEEYYKNSVGGMTIQDVKNGKAHIIDLTQKESEAEKHANRSNAMRGNQNAKKLFSELSGTEKAQKAEQIRNNVVASVKANSVPYDNDGRYDTAAKNWIKSNQQGKANTVIGDVIVNEKSVMRDMHHGSENDKYLKLQTLPAVKDILENGTYLGYERDFDGKNIDNHYFAGKIKYGNEEKIVFCRVRENAGDENRFYVHEVFTEDELKKEASQVPDIDVGLPQLTGKPHKEAVRRTSNPSSLRLTGKPLYQYILQDVLKVNENSENSGIISNGGKNGKDNTGAEQAGLSERSADLRGGRSEEPGNQNAAGAERGDNGDKTLLGADQSGDGLGNADGSVNVGRGRITKGQAREIRRQCREILGKPDSAITADDKAVLSQYVGAGGTGEDDASNSGTLYEFYTPRNVISKVWQIVDKYNPEQGKRVIEPSSGIGRFAEGRNEKFTLFELEEESARIAHILHPEADVVQGAFQENFMKSKGGRFTKKFTPYDVAVGNPPYGAYTGKYKGLGEGKNFKRYESYFMARSLDTLKDGGIMAMVVPSGFMDGKSTYGKDLERIAEKGELLEAWRLPNGTFDSTDVGTDIVVFRKGKGGSVEQIKSYFDKNPDHIAGEISTRTNRFGKEESYVKPKDGQTFESAVDSIDAGAADKEQQAKEISQAVEAKETEAEKHANRSEAMRGNQNAKKDFKNLSEAIKNKSSFEVENPSLGNVSVDFSVNRGKNGLIHIIKRRFEELYKNGKGETDLSSIEKRIAAILYSVLNNVKTGVPKAGTNGNTWSLKQNGITAIVKQDKGKFLLTGFADNASEKEAAETIDAVNAEYGYTPEFLDLYAQVGAVIASKNNDISGTKNVNGKRTLDLSGGLEDIGKTGTAKKLFSEFVDNFIASDYKSDKIVNLLDSTPDILKENGIPDNPISIAPSVMKKILQDDSNIYHGHSIAPEILKDLPNQLENPVYILKGKNGRKIIVTEHYVENRPVICVLEIDRKEGRINVNSVRSLYDKHNEVFMDWIKNPENVEYVNQEKSKVLLQSIGTQYAKEATTPYATNNTSNGKNVNGKRTLDLSGGLEDTGKTGTAKNGNTYRIYVPTSDFWNIYKESKGDLKENGYQLSKTKDGWRVFDYNVDGNKAAGERKTDAEKKENRSRAMQGNRNAEGEHNVSMNPNAHKMSVEEFNRKYGKNYDAKDMPIWKATDRAGNIDMTKLSDSEREYVEKSDHYVKDGGMYVNTVNYASGNIREKLNALSKDDPQYDFKKSLLEAVCPEEKKIGQFTLSPITDWAREYRTQGGRSLIDGFFEWAYNGHGYYSASESPIAREEIPPDLTFSDIKDFIEKTPYKMSRSEARDFDDKKQAAKARERRKQLRRETAIKLFNRYLQEGLPVDDQKDLTEAYNLKANSFVNPDFSKIPVFVEGMSTHKGSKEFTLMEQQMKGISMLTNKGTGLLAYDVGVGKTACGVVATVNQIQTGRAKRPLICVPKAVYSNWIDNIHELFPDIKVNGLGNLSKDYWNEEMSIEPGTISVCTYEGLENIGFNAEEEAELKEDIEFASYTDNGGKKETARQKASKDEKTNEKLGEMLRTRNEDWVPFSYLGFDHITVDEAHNFRNLFKMPRHINKKKDDDDENSKVESNEFDGLGSGGEPSNRAKKLFAITQLIQRHNGGRNTFLLSATPFQNSPTEIYSILSYMARDELKKRGFYSLEQFVSNFCKVQREYVVKANRVTEAPVVKGFENLSELQNLLTSYIDKVDGEEAGVVRPYKRMHTPELELSEQQKEIMANISEYIEEQEATPKEDRDDGYMFRAMNAMKNCALSPALVTDSEFNPFDTAKMGFVESSPKLKFVCDSIIGQYKKNPHNGQIMYMPLGVEQFPKVKEYLVKHGMPKEAIATISGGATTDKAMDARDAIFKDFNNADGKCKVIIGSSTIKEGCNLQGNTTTIYCTQLDWNPTDVQQLWGRGWRQGNKQGIVHCVTPLMHDSLDPMIYQKHDEKSARTNDIYSFKGDKMNSQDVNPEELKFALIKDPAKRADLQVLEYSEKNRSDEKMYGQMIDVLHKQIDIAFETDESIEKKADEKLPWGSTLKGTQENIDNYKASVGNAKKAIAALTKKYKGKKDEWEKDFPQILKETEKLKLPGFYLSSWSTWSLEEYIDYLNRKKKDYEDEIVSLNSGIRQHTSEKRKLEKTREAQRKYLESKGIMSAGDGERKIQDYVKLMDTARSNVAKAKDMRAEFYEKAVADNKANEKNLLGVDELVKENVDSIMNDLHPMDEEWKARIKAENDKRFGRVSKSLPMFFFMNGRFYINKSVKARV